MTRLLAVTVIIGLALAGSPLLAGTDSAREGALQTGPPTPAIPVKTTTASVSSHLTSLAGMHLWIVDAEVREVLSPQAFVIDSSWGYRDRRMPESRVLVVTASPAPRVREGQLVEVFGRSFTLAGAEAQPEWAAASAAPDIVHKFARRPIIIATGVQTPGSVPLYGQPPREALSTPLMSPRRLR